MKTSEEIEQAIKESNGNVRDALNKALFKISQQADRIKILEEEIEKLHNFYGDIID